MRILNSVLTTVSSILLFFGILGAVMSGADSNLPAQQAFGLAAAGGFVILTLCIIGNFRHNAKMRKAAAEPNDEE